MNTQPPRFNPKRRNPITAILIVLIVIILLGTIGIVSYSSFKSDKNTATKSNGVTIQQITGNKGDNGKIVVEDVSEIVKIARPSVVEITTEIISSGNSIFGQYVQQGAGSGVIMSEDGYIITNNHVIEGANTIQVTTSDGQSYSATLVGTDPSTDLAVIKIDANGLTAATFGDSDALEVGDAVIAIGNPLGSLGGTTTKGIISALDREITIDGETMTLLQTDAAINPGNSGGGLFDANGNLIGIVNAKQSAEGIEGLGFAIPISGAIDILNELVTNGTVTNRAALNVSLQDIEEGMYQNSDLQPGVYIVQIVDGGAAQQAGLEVGDRIIEFDGKSVNSSAEVKKILRNHKAGDVISMKVDRDGTMEEVQINLGSSLSN